MQSIYLKTIAPAVLLCSLASQVFSAGLTTEKYGLQVIDLSTVSVTGYEKPNGINDLGQVLFGREDGARVVWDPSDTFYSVPMNTADAMNNNGWVVGHGPQTAIDRGIHDNVFAAAYNIYTQQLIEVPTWLDDRPDLIPNAGTIDDQNKPVETKLYGVNDAGIAVGRTKNNADPRWQPFAFDINTNEYYPLKRTVNVGDAGSRQAYVVETGGDAINNNGLVLGSEEVKSGTGLDVVIWNSATDAYADMAIVQMPDETGVVPGAGESNGKEIALNDNNVVLMDVGSQYSLNQYHPATNTTTFLGLVPLEAGTTRHDFWDMNDDGVLLGESRNIVGPRLWTAADGYVPVQSLLGNAWSGWTIDDAFWINNNQQIVASAVNPAGDTKLVLMTPVPEPSTMGLLASFASLCMVRRRRKSQLVA